MELNNEHRFILSELVGKYEYSQKQGGTAFVGKVWFKGLDTEIAHLQEIGYLSAEKRNGHIDLAITKTGLQEMQRISDPAETLRAEIAALERQLADKRAALGAVESGENSLD